MVKSTKKLIESEEMDISSPKRQNSTPKNKHKLTRLDNLREGSSPAVLTDPESEIIPIISKEEITESELLETREENNLSDMEDLDNIEDEDEELLDSRFANKVKNAGRTDLELRSLIENLDDEQVKRYEIYRRSALSKPTIKKVLSGICNQQISQTISMVAAGFSKVFIGEIVELALEVKKEWETKALIAESIKKGNSSPISPPLYNEGRTPLLPEHLREAYRRYRLNHPLLNPGVRRKRLFKR